ncbi:hypothetical protein V8E53_000206, partial [Lactarius tabidus]
PTRALGDSTRIHLVLKTFFRNSVRSHEKRRRRNAFLVPEFTRTKPAYYLLTIEPMIEDNYLVYSYLADVFQKPEDLERDASSCA